MSTSGSYNFTANRDEVIKGAMRMAAGLGDWEAPQPSQVTTAAFLLNSIIKSYHNIGMPVWTHVKISIPAISFDSEGKVTIGPAGTFPTAKPLKVSQVILNYDGSSRPLELLDKQSFNLYNNPETTDGTPVAAHFQPLRDTSVLYIWPVPDQDVILGATVDIYHQVSLQDVDIASDELDFPVEWLRLLRYELAVDLAPEYGLPMAERAMLVAERDLLKKEAMAFDVEEGSIFLQP